MQHTSNILSTTYSVWLVQVLSCFWTGKSQLIQSALQLKNCILPPKIFSKDSWTIPTSALAGPFEAIPECPTLGWETPGNPQQHLKAPAHFFKYCEACFWKTSLEKQPLVSSCFCSMALDLVLDQFFGLRWITFLSEQASCCRTWCVGLSLLKHHRNRFRKWTSWLVFSLLDGGRTWGSFFPAIQINFQLRRSSNVIHSCGKAHLACSIRYKPFCWRSQQVR